MVDFRYILGEDDRRTEMTNHISIEPPSKQACCPGRRRAVKRFVTTLISVVFFLGQGILALAQSPDNSSPPKTGAALEIGVVDGHTYKNKFLNAQFTVPDDLEFRPPEMSGKPGETPHSVGVSAWSKAHSKLSFKKYIVDRGVIFVADDLDSYAEGERTPTGYLRHVGQAEVREGFKAIDGKTDAKIGDVEFARGNFKQRDRLHIVFITTRYGYAFTIIFVANDMESVEAMIKSTSLKLPQ